MPKTFDTLFEEFINDDKSDSQDKRSEIKRVIHTIANFKKITSGELSPEDIEAQLGEPTSVENHIENGIMFTRMIWKTPQGDFTKIVSTDILPETENMPTVEILEELLAEAVAVEDYPRAIVIRDELKKRAEKK